MGERTVVHCPTKELWRKVARKFVDEGSKGFCGGLIKAECWDMYESDSCINREFLRERGTLTRDDLDTAMQELATYSWDGVDTSGTQLPSVNQNTVNKITSRLKRIFDKDQRRLYKAGLIDDCGRVTPQGDNELAEILWQEKKEKLVERAEEIIKKNKEEENERT